MRKVDYHKKKLTDLSKRQRNIKRLMSKENNKLNLRITSSNIYIRFNLWLKMRKSKIKSLMLKEHRSTPNVRNYSNGYILTKMLLRMSMRKRERNLKPYITQSLLRSMVNKDKDSQVLDHKISKEDKDSQELVLRVINRVIKELISMILTDTNNFKHFIFYIFF